MLWHMRSSTDTRLKLVVGQTVGGKRLPSQRGEEWLPEDVKVIWVTDVKVLLILVLWLSNKRREGNSCCFGGGTR